jgi:hypothetical protein
LINDFFAVLLHFKWCVVADREFLLKMMFRIKRGNISLERMFGWDAEDIYFKME